MLNLKKGLALVLAAATAFTFAPVANLGSSVNAEAADLYNRQSVTVKSETGYWVKQASNYSANAGDKLSVKAKDNYFKELAFVQDNEKQTQAGKSNYTVTGTAAITEGQGAVVGDTKALYIEPIKTYKQLSTTLTITVGSVKQTLQVVIEPKKKTPDWNNVTKKKNPSSLKHGNIYSYEDQTVDTSDKTYDLQNLTEGDAAFVVRGAEAEDGTTFEITDITSKDPSIVKIEEDTDAGSSTTSKVKVNPQKKGNTQLTIKYKQTIPADDNEASTSPAPLPENRRDGRKQNVTETATINVSVSAKTSVFKVGNTEVSDTTSYSAANTVQTVEVTPNTTANITATLDNATAGEGIYFYSVGNGVDPTAGAAFASAQLPKIDTSDKTTVEQIHDDGDITVTPETQANATSLTTKVTGLAAAFDTDKVRSDNDETAYYVLVTNYPLNDKSVDSRSKKGGVAAGKEKAAFVKVLARKNARQFASITATVDGTTYDKVTSGYADSTSSGIAYKDQETRNATSIYLSTQDKKSVGYSVVALPDNAANLSVTSNNTNLVTIDKDKKTINLVGTSVNEDTTVDVTFKVTGDSHYYGTASFVLPVVVTNKKVNVAITAPETINLTKADYKKAKAIGATVTADSGLKLAYDWVDAAKDDANVLASNAGVTLDKTAATLTYNNQTNGSAILRVSAAGTSTVVAPKTKYITVNYDYADQGDPVLSVDKKSLNLSVGDTADIKVLNAASGAAITYASSDESIATVTAATSGASITAVAPGVAVITVTDPGTDTIKGATQEITVNVKADTVAPKKVTGLKVSNKKGAYVSVKWTSQGGNVNYRIYKKVGNGKWIGKNVAGNKTSLKVKKGAKVQVKVKAYVKNAAGKTTWGPKATKAKTFKTDKK